MTKKRVLIVDDEKEFAEGMAARCRRLGLEAETASNSLTALTLINARRPDLICLDIEMPTGNGLSVCEFLGSDPATARTPIIILTGRKDAETRRRCGELRAYYIPKSPGLWDALRPVICELLDFQPTPRESEMLNS